MLFRISLVCLLFSVSGSVHAQNLVPDPGFENWNGTIGNNPNTLGGLLIWDEVNGTPDHHHILNPLGSNLTSLDTTCSTAVGQNQCGFPQEGQAVLGAYKGNGATGTKEWAATPLTAPMVVGQTYKVGYWIQNKKTNPSFLMETNQWGMYFSTTLIPPFNPNTANFSAMTADYVTSAQIVDDTVWHYLEWNYTPCQPYDHIYVGYVGDVVNSTTNAWSNSGSVGFYTWIDSVFVEQITSTAYLQAAGDTTICNGDSTQISVSSNQPVQWSTGQTDSIIWVSPSVAATYYVSNGGGCSISDSVVVDVTSCCTIVLTNTITGVDNTACPGLACNGTVEAVPQNGIGPYSYLWDDPSAQTSSLASGLCGGTYTCIVSDANGCADTVSVTITDPGNAPVITSVVADETCLGNNDGMIDLTITGGALPLSVLWSNGAITQDIMNLAGGQYSVQVTDANGCVHTDSVLVNSGPPITTVSVQAASFCDGDPSTALSATPIGGVWSGTVSSTGIFDPAVGIGSHNVIYTIPGTCGGADTISVLVDAIPNVSFSADVLFGCDPLTVNFIDSSYVMSQTANWDFGDGSTSAQGGTAQHTYTAPGTYDVSLTITSQAGCTGALTIPTLIQVFNDPVADFSYGLVEVTETSDVQFIDISTGAAQWLWDFGDGSTSIEQNPLHVYANAGTYTVELQIVSIDGCLGTVSYTIIVPDNLNIYVPNSFSPNGDGINDYFLPVVRGISPEDYQFMVFDRWGAQIFSSTQPYEPWLGSFNNGGKLVPDGVYVWQLIVSPIDGPEEIIKRGHVLVMH